MSHPSHLETFFRTHGLLFLAALLLATHWLDGSDRFHRAQLLGHCRPSRGDGSARPSHADALYRILRGTPVERPVRTVVQATVPESSPTTVSDS